MGEEAPFDTRLALAVGGDVDAFVARKRKQPAEFHILLPSHAEEEPGRSWREDQGPGRLTLRSDAAAKTTDADGTGTRKKLRLTKEQWDFLDNRYRENSALTPMQKPELADLLNLRPRQVEVWFQNRRARTKLKQKELDCEFLKKCCESLTEENRQLKEELQELRSVKQSPTVVVRLPKTTTLTISPSHERLSAGDDKIASPGFDGKTEERSRPVKASCLER
ncbi:unnamed protein product [Spirodela intermedia]|uniref:Homeobox domain-containing protein n=1 Tax=Spirodela intermedia TaxID=51605 RepID=A0A7I8LC16_SPIIN|nr:unnamed protein product [Spirodela intermedia]